MKLGRYSFGMGDRFGHQASAQLEACLQAKSELGISVTPVWNKSHREHTIIGSHPDSTRDAAELAIRQLAPELPYFVDADHINLETVDSFLAASNFFTIDVADSIGQPVADEVIEAFCDQHPELIGEISISGIRSPLTISETDLRSFASTYLGATIKAAEIYQKIVAEKGLSNFIAEVSMDETDTPQTPAELLVILAALADQKISVQTIAPKFSGRFNKGVDYVGDVAQFKQEFADDIAVIAYAITAYHLPEDLKLSVHSGSDKFSIYPAMGEILRATGAGLHIKTAGTTWLEELIGLAEADGEGLKLAKQIYQRALVQQEELCAPYSTVIDIDASQLPSAAEVEDWSSKKFQDALRHIPGHSGYNPHFRQLLHVGFKVAAQLGSAYTDLLEANAPIIGRNVTENLYERHLKRLFEATST